MAVAVVLVPDVLVALPSRMMMVPTLMWIFVVVEETFVVTFVELVLGRPVLCVASSAGRWFRSLGRSVWTSTRCLCPCLHLCCLWRLLASGLLGRRCRVTIRSWLLSGSVLLKRICTAFVRWATGIPFLFPVVVGGMCLHGHRYVLGVYASWWLLVVRCGGC